MTRATWAATTVAVIAVVGWWRAENALRDCIVTRDEWTDAAIRLQSEVLPLSRTSPL